MSRWPYLAFALLILLAGCGQKGPLYLPEQTTQSQPSER